MKFLVALFIAIFSVVVSVSAQYVPPSTTSLQFRLYGKDAKPVNTSDKEYNVIVDTSLYRSGYDRGIQTGLTDNEISVRVREYFYSGVRMKLIQQLDTMDLYSNYGIDSLQFTPGKFYVSAGYSPLFYSQAKLHQNIWPSIEDFRTDYLHGFDVELPTDDTFIPPTNARVLTPNDYYATRPTLYFDHDSIQVEQIVDYVALPQSHKVIAAINGADRSVIIQSTDLGRTWQSFGYPASSDSIASVQLYEEYIYAYVIDKEKNTMARRWYPNHPLRSERLHRLPQRTYYLDSSAANVTPDIRFGVLHAAPINANGEVTLIRSTNRGLSWSSIFTTPSTIGMSVPGLAGSNYVGLHVLDSNSILYLHPSFLLLSRDQGNSWRYYPFDTPRYLLKRWHIAFPEVFKRSVRLNSENIIASDGVRLFFISLKDL